MIGFQQNTVRQTNKLDGITYIQSIKTVSEWALMLDLAHEEIIQNKAKGKMPEAKN